jgi:mannitol-1-phosphate 5-dehydrogenase
VIDKDKIVIFGAGKIGRSFIGQLFGISGYRVVFVDVDPLMIKLLNERSSYKVIIKGDREEEITVDNVSAISALDREAVKDSVAGAAIVAVSVGKFALEKVLPVVASALVKRLKDDPGSPLDIILAENMRSAAEFAREQLGKYLPADFPLSEYVGLIETSIGKMVPIMPLAEVARDPLMVFAEPYNSLILDGKGFKAPIPKVKGLAAKNNIKAWVDRKAFIHNLGHATAAYSGHFLHPDLTYMYQVLDDSEVYRFTRKTMLEAAAVLHKVYCNDYTISELEDHIDDLLHRFMNRALQDTVFRVGQDLQRKLGSDDRFLGAVHLAETARMPYDGILKAMSYGFFFHAGDEEGKMFPPDTAFHEALAGDFDKALVDLLHVDPVMESHLIRTLKNNFKELDKAQLEKNNT